MPVFVGQGRGYSSGHACMAAGCALLRTPPQRQGAHQKGKRQQTGRKSMFALMTVILLPHEIKIIKNHASI